MYTSGAINRHKTRQAPSTSGYPQQRPRSNVYINPNYKPDNRPTRPKIPTAKPLQASGSASATTSQKRDVVIDGVAFESSGRSLVRKDCMSLFFNLYLPSQVKPSRMQPTMTSTVVTQVPVRLTAPPQHVPGQYPRNKPHRVYKSRTTAHRGRPTNRNMTLDNTRRSFQSVWYSNDVSANVLRRLYRSRRISSKRSKVNKPCPRFTTTGTSSPYNC